MTNKTLSNKAVRDLSNNPIPNYYWEQDVKEFIKKLKEEIRNIGCEVQKDKSTTSEDYRFALRDCLNLIDKLAGKELI